jgi:hypothetical protein
MAVTDARPATAATMATNRTMVASRRATASHAGAGPRRRASPAADRLTVALFSLTAFLIVLTLLVRQLPTVSHRDARPVRVLRKIYRTTVIETVWSAVGRGTAVTQSVSSSSSGPAVLPTTRAS